MTITTAVRTDVETIQSTMDHPVNEYVPALCTAYECGLAAAKMAKYGTPLPTDWRSIDSFSHVERNAFESGYSEGLLK
jgi:hypothetical protein